MKGNLINMPDLKLIKVKITISAILIAILSQGHCIGMLIMIIICITADLAHLNEEVEIHLQAETRNCK